MEKFSALPETTRGRSKRSSKICSSRAIRPTGQLAALFEEMRVRVKK